MSPPEIARVHYYNGQSLRPLEMTDEQSYHIAMRRRHNIAGHSWGIVSGLDLALGDDGLPVVRPGLAIDGYGRELVLILDATIDTTLFGRRESETLDVFLNYGTTPSSSVDTSEENLGTSAPADREVEEPSLQLEVPEPPPADRRRPAQVVPADLDFGPDRLPPDDPNRAWPVFLGQVTRQQGATSATPTQYSVDPADRPYAGLVGADVVDPTARTLLTLGSPDEVASSRFAVRVAPPSPDGSGIPVADTSPRLAIGAHGSILLAGKTTVAGDLTIDNGALIFRRNPQGDANTIPKPGTIYRLDTPAPAATAASAAKATTPTPPGPGTPTPPVATMGTAPATGGATAPTAPTDPDDNVDNDGGTHDLRIVIDAGGNLVVGAFSQPPGTPKPAFQASFAVGPDAVTVFGNLKVAGFITQNSKPAEVPENNATNAPASALVTGAQSSGVTNPGTIPNNHDRSPYDLLAGLIGSQDGGTALRTFLEANSLVEKLVAIVPTAKGGTKAMIAEILKGF